MQLSAFAPSAYVGLEGKHSESPGSIGDKRKKGLGPRVPIWGAVKSRATYTPTLSGCMSNDIFFLSFGILGYSS